MCSRSKNGLRRGSIAIAVLILLPLLLLAVALGLHGIELRAAQTEMQNAVDAASLAAARGLVSDELLNGDSDNVKDLAGRSAQAARLLASGNPVLGRPLGLRENPRNDSGGDIVFGRFNPQSGLIQPVSMADDWTTIDAVLVVGRKTRERNDSAMLLKGPLLSRGPVDLQVSSLAMLDRGVIGFRPVHGTVIPLMPIGLRENEAQRGVPASASAAQGRGWTARLGFEDGNACLLQLGSQDFDDVLRQMIQGVKESDLTDFGGELVLNTNSRKPVPGAKSFAQGTTADRLAEAAHAVRGQTRFWPLFEGFDNAGRPVLSGFVAAKIEAVTREENGLVIQLRPTLASSPTVVVASMRPEWRGLAWPRNQFACKVRLVR